MQPECLVVSNESRHEDIAQRTTSAIKHLQEAGERISFYAVAEKAQVSRSTLYRCGDLRRLVEAARAGGAVPLCAATDGYDSKVAQLEDELARVLHERDVLEQMIRAGGSTCYAFTRMDEAA